MSDFTAKYRPQKVSELDLFSTRDQLANVLRSAQIPHAFLFAGPRGIGKTSAARIVAKAVNCQENAYGKWHMADSKTTKSISDKQDAISEFEPCNRCGQCLSITAGNNLDVLEIDAASNRGIDDIRDLREKVRLAPNAARYKVYIIDEAHMLTTEAFNALLKTLEEPPSHVIFILCTTAPEKLPETIISRCQRFNFKRATEPEIIEKLKKIVNGEKIKIEEEALGLIAKAVGGSFRDGTKILEQLSTSEGSITKQMVEEILGQVVGLEPIKLLESLAAKDVRSSLAQVERAVAMGGNLRIYAEQVLEVLHHCLLASLGVVQEGSTTKDLDLKTEQISLLIDILSRATRDLKDAVIPQLPLEMAVIEWCGNDENEKLKMKNEKREEDGGSSESVPPQTLKSGLVKGAGGVSFETIQARWHEVLLRVRPKNHSVEALLRATRPSQINGNVLILEVFYQFHKDKLESEKCRQILEETINEVFGIPVRIRCVLGEKSRIVPDGKLADKQVEDTDIIKAAEEIFSATAE